MAGPFWERVLAPLAVPLFLVFSSWHSTFLTGARALGRQCESMLVSAPITSSSPPAFRFVPIPSIPPCFDLLCTGFLIPWWLLLPSLLLFIIGTRIRVRIEDHCLASHFGERFIEYQQRSPGLHSSSNSRGAAAASPSWHLSCV